MSISAAGARCRGKNNRGEYPPTNGYDWFIYNGKKLTQLRDELENK